MPEATTVEEVRDHISFHLDWAEVDISVHPLLSDLAPRDTWLRWEEEGLLEGLFVHTVHAGTDAINRALLRDDVPFAQRCELLSRALMILSMSPPYDGLPLQAATLAQMAFSAQMHHDDDVTLDDLPVGRDQMNLDHLIAATEAAFGLTLTFLRAYSLAGEKGGEIS